MFRTLVVVLYLFHVSCLLFLNYYYCFFYLFLLFLIGLKARILAQNRAHSSDQQPRRKAGPKPAGHSSSPVCPRITGPMASQLSSFFSPTQAICWFSFLPCGQWKQAFNFYMKQALRPSQVTARCCFFLSCPREAFAKLAFPFGFPSWQHGLLTFVSSSTSTPCPASVTW